MKDDCELGATLYGSTSYSMPHGTCLLTTGTVYTTYAANWVVIFTACSDTSIVQCDEMQGNK